MFPGGIERGQWHEIAFLTYPEAFQKNKNKKKINKLGLGFLLN